LSLQHNGMRGVRGGSAQVLDESAHGTFSKLGATSGPRTRSAHLLPSRSDVLGFSGSKHFPQVPRRICVDFYIFGIYLSSPRCSCKNKNELQDLFTVRASLLPCCYHFKTFHPFLIQYDSLRKGMARIWTNRHLYHCLKLRHLERSPGLWGCIGDCSKGSTSHWKKANTT